MENLEKIFIFLKEAEKLKSAFRYNKSSSGRNESSADHSWRLALMVPIFIKELKLDLDVKKCIEIALVHDLPEALTGDIDAIKISEGKVLKQEKEKLELEAMDKLKQILPKETGNYIYNLWQEYQIASTGEGRFVKGLDKTETLNQLADVGYRTYDKPKFIAEYAEKAIKNFPELAGPLTDVKERLKKEFEKGGFLWET